LKYLPLVLSGKYFSPNKCYISELVYTCSLRIYVFHGAYSAEQSRAEQQRRSGAEPRSRAAAAAAEHSSSSSRAQQQQQQSTAAVAAGRKPLAHTFIISFSLLFYCYLVSSPVQASSSAQVWQNNKKRRTDGNQAERNHIKCKPATSLHTISIGLTCTVQVIKPQFTHD
jgi:hypothetical protein